MSIRLWAEEHIITAKGDKLSGKRINEKWFLTHGFGDQYNEISQLHENFTVACKLALGWTAISTCKGCGKETLHPRIYCSTKCQVNDPEWKENKRQKLLERYGVENPFQKGSLRDKFEQENLERFGHRFPIVSKEVRNKAKATCLENHGVEYSLQSRKIHDKTKRTIKERYGVENVAHINGVSEKETNQFIKIWNTYSGTERIY